MISPLHNSKDAKDTIQGGRGEADQNPNTLRLFCPYKKGFEKVPNSFLKIQMWGRVGVFKKNFKQKLIFLWDGFPKSLN